MFMFDELNKDQLSGLANLCFDLAKGAIIFAFFPATQIGENFWLNIGRIIIALITGIAFTYYALLLLRAKGEVK